MGEYCSVATSTRMCPISRISCPGECMYADIMEKINVGIIVIDGVRKAVIFRNKTANEILSSVANAGEYASLESVLDLHHLVQRDGQEVNEQRSLKIGIRDVGYTVYGIGNGYLWIMIRDITVRKSIEKQNALLAAAVQSSEEEMAIIDRTGRIQYVNPAYETASTVSYQNLIGNNITELLRDRYGLKFNDALADVMMEGKPWRGRLRSKNPDGIYCEEDAAITPVRDRDGEIVNYVVVKKDVTDRTRLESIAAAVNHMNNIGYIFSGIRHEIGNPVNSIKMTLSVLENNIESYSIDNIRTYMDRAMTEILRIEELLKSLKNFNMFESPTIQIVDVEVFLGKFLSLVREDFSSEGIIVKKVVHPEARAMLVDPRALQQVLMNIFTNAADALEDIDDPKIVIHAIRYRDQVILRTVDNGCGIPSNQKNRLFVPFVTTKSSGTGLGLIIVRKMLSLMHCDIEITSEKNAGTIVDIIIPAVRGPEAK